MSDDFETMRKHMHQSCITVGVNADERCIEAKAALDRIEARLREAETKASKAETKYTIADVQAEKYRREAHDLAVRLREAEEARRIEAEAFDEMSARVAELEQNLFAARQAVLTEGQEVERLREELAEASHVEYR